MMLSIVNGRICLLPKLTATIILAQIIGKIYKYITTAKKNCGHITN